ncbi:isoprenylcysteine carboxylmethyltransferase family protein [Treponema phagedenis]|uniref:Isoprenylcysteine carboxylmethyltransferase family protein n=1 Tax=Treponema phagedenis TaxID=162 RepID=A0A0B7H279_TREPH|nr:isoprenylcysteine carboxylmethyltransferase family protein [Treponema phagedenis]EFW36835.1 hypothetical protein HMPREF9554_02694 [Treponema phagedenis F0421]NVP24042.1 isoprenylcysteine carboxylmethyltransferase family protein [Treponema phagedenis]QEJ96188.1 isoprenylcysteine carboxylmethyltransferase family protein [Treponema phagedenis]QEJ99388.1 isoprenylcysteine carboxylmethyltransferase family protein [Treponema phagedenis]QEJ99889.1 isoprenylcysteine carboxylmethyltransferase family
MQKNHLPLLGVGPLYVISIILITAAGGLFTCLGIIAGGKIPLIVPCVIAGICFIGIGIALWIAAVFFSKIDANIIANKLVTDGVYRIVRNPIYSAFLFVCTGVLLLFCNWYLLLLPPIFFLYLTLLMKYTEEKWLLQQYGEEYQDYCKRVNRCIPSVRGLLHGGNKGFGNKNAGNTGNPMEEHK